MNWKPWVAGISSMLILSGVLHAQAPPAPLYPVPSATQLAWHEMETNAFVHFNINTFTDKEWGYGDEFPELFNPSDADPGQWARILKETGFGMLILTCKHHDGFCLWPSKFSDRTIAASPYKNGKGDLVRETSAAAARYGLRFGIYLSPWDRSRSDYGSAAYISYYRNQLRELFGQYGPVFEMWFDGANGGDGYYGGAREKRSIDGQHYYDWPGTLALVKSLQPKVLFFSDAGPGVRWVGNENGEAGETNWNTISADTLYAGKAGIETLLGTGSSDGNQWIPAEVDVSIRPGWFYHASEDSLVKSPQKLFSIYLHSVGRGSTLLLNIPPDRSGRFHETDVQALVAFRALLKKELGHNLAAHARVTAENFRGRQKEFSPENLTDGNKETYWATDDSVHAAAVVIRLKKPETVKYILLQEYIQLGQRVSAFAIDGWTGAGWRQVASGTTIGHKRILSLDSVRTDRVRVRIIDSKACPVLTAIELY